MNRCNTEDFQDNETTLYDTAMVDTCHYPFVQIHRMYNTKSKPRCELWTWSDNDVSVQLIDYNESTSLLEEADNEGVYTCVRVGVYENCAVHSILL